MDTGMMCPECLSECAWISTTRSDYFWCTKCDVRYVKDLVLSEKETRDEMLKRVENWEEPHFYDFVCPNCKHTQRVVLGVKLVSGSSNPKLICSNCKDRLVLRVPYSAFTK